MIFFMSRFGCGSFWFLIFSLGFVEVSFSIPLPPSISLCLSPSLAIFWHSQGVRIDTLGVGQLVCCCFFSATTFWFYRFLSVPSSLIFDEIIFGNWDAMKADLPPA